MISTFTPCIICIQKTQLLYVITPHQCNVYLHPYIFEQWIFIWRFEIPHSDFSTSIDTYYTWSFSHKISNMFDALQVARLMKRMAPHFEILTHQLAPPWYHSMYGGPKIGFQTHRRGAHRKFLRLSLLIFMKDFVIFSTFRCAHPVSARE